MFVLSLQLLFRLIVVPHPEWAQTAPFDKCCRISEVSKLCICTCICTCNPTLKHWCPYHKCTSVPSHQKDKKCLRSTSNLKFSWLVSWRHILGKKSGGIERSWVCAVTQESRDRREHRTQDMTAGVSVKDHWEPLAKWPSIIEHVSR